MAKAKHTQKRQKSAYVPLRFCPFCNSSSIRVVYSMRKEFYCRCGWCGARGAVKKCRESAIESWNNRNSEPSIDEMKRRLEKSGYSVAKPLTGVHYGIRNG